MHYAWYQLYFFAYVVLVSTIKDRVLVVKLLNALNAMAMVLSYKHAQDAMVTDRFIAMIAME